MVEDVDKLFHTYAMDWLPDRVEASVDGKLYFTFLKPVEASVETWPFDQRFHLLLNIAIGGSWGGLEGIDDEMFNTPVRMEVDYVRVYKYD